MQQVTTPRQNTIPRDLPVGKTATYKFYLPLYNQKTKQKISGEVNIRFSSEDFADKYFGTDFDIIGENKYLGLYISRKYRHCHLDDDYIEPVGITDENPDLIINDECENQTTIFRLSLYNRKENNRKSGTVKINFPSNRCFERHFDESFVYICNSSLLDKFLEKTYPNYYIDDFMEPISETNEEPDVVLKEDE